MEVATLDPLAGLAGTPWRPQSLLPPPSPALALRWRVLILLIIVLLHLVGSALLLRLLADNDDAADSEVVLLLNFDESRPPVVPPAKAPAVARASAHLPITPKPKPKPKPSKPATASAVRPPASTSADADLQIQLSAPVPGKRSDSKLQLYNADGRLRVPDDMLAQIDDPLGEQRKFSYQIPRMDDARKVFYRNQVLAFESTRFDQYWQPDQDMLTELLTKLVEKTTKQIKVPIPGHPGSTMVCSISLIALAGGCGVLTNGSDYVGPLDDPDTLNPEEDRQCRAWWQQIVGARTQEVWRSTRSLYEAQCRKPLLRPK